MKKQCAFTFFLTLSIFAFGQTEYAYETFDDTRIVNGHSVETNNEGILTFIIAHRFGPMNSGPKYLWGLDNANMRMGLDYGITNNLSVGLGRSSFDGTVDGFVKYKMLAQSSGDKNMPFSLTLLGTYGIKTQDFIGNYTFDEVSFEHKSSYVGQLLIARKFGSKISAQLMPSFVHRNLVRDNEKNDVMSLGIAGQYQLLKNLSLSAEYYAISKSSQTGESHPSLSFGFQVDTKGHVFQFHLSNGAGMVERIFITETNGSWENGDIFFGFNISRDFKVKGRKIR